MVLETQYVTVSKTFSWIFFFLKKFFFKEKKKDEERNMDLFQFESKPN